MILTFNSNHEKVNEFIAGTHPFDKTVRPQIVKQDNNPECYKIIEYFQELSGLTGEILNSFFNQHGFPLVHMPKDALNVFDQSGLKNLAIDKFLLTKTKK
ncbi:MAG: hypothetical protein K8S16_21860 [Bacteroidales bacterium]|nr:hypothetical protein [Bacteroidales bacterium]